MFKIASLSARRLGRSPSFPVNVRPTRADVAVAHSIARSTAPAPEQVARALTWGADEKLLLVLTAVGWLASRGCGVPLRRAGNHALPVTVTASLLPDDLKLVFDQTRPDRQTVIGHMHGVPLSGKRKDAFPSGHALHMDWHRRPAGCQLVPGGRSARLRSGCRSLALRSWRIGRAMSLPASHSGRFSNGASGFGPATRTEFQRRMIMPTLEDLKGYMERATGLKRPGKRKAVDLARARKPVTVRFKDDGLIPNHPRWPLVLYRNAVAFDEDLDAAA